MSDFYVYTHAYPDNFINAEGLDVSNAIFYVGKGTGDRIFGHETEARSGVVTKKCDVIREIWAQGREVVKAIVFETDDEQEAYKVERILINTLKPTGRLTNGCISQNERSLKYVQREVTARMFNMQQRVHEETLQEFRERTFTLSEYANKRLRRRAVSARWNPEGLLEYLVSLGQYPK